MTHLLNILLCSVLFLVAVVESQLQCKKSNEEVRCMKKCPFEKTCRLRFINYLCVKDDNPCVNKCVCKDGFYRNSIGSCNTAAQCDQCSKPNEHYECGGLCDNVCSTIKYQNRTHCPYVNIVCNKQCYCDPGYARDDNGNCIPIEQCGDVKNKNAELPISGIAGPSCADRNEEYVISTSCPSDICESLNIDYICDPDEVPQERCRCKPGFRRIAQTGKCFPSSRCPPFSSSTS